MRELGQSPAGEGFDAHLVKPVDLSAVVAIVMGVGQPVLAKPALA